MSLNRVFQQIIPQFYSTDGFTVSTDKCNLGTLQYSESGLGGQSALSQIKRNTWCHSASWMGLF